MIGIYKITNQTNGKSYIGQSIQVEKRWQRHKTTAFNENDECYEYPLYRAIRKYGLEQFTFEIIEQCNEEFLNEREIFWIDTYKTFLIENGYNLTKGGNAGGFAVLTDEQVDEIIQQLINTKLSQQKIADNFNVTQRMISAICLGQTRVKKGLIYPLRVERSNAKESKLCIDCGVIINDNSISRCINCYNISQRKTERPSREILKQEIRTTSFTTLGKKYNVSDNAVRKWCKVYNLPYKTTEIKKISDTEWATI